MLPCRPRGRQRLLSPKSSSSINHRRRSCVRKRQLVRWGPVSTGRAETPTPAGAFTSPEVAQAHEHRQRGVDPRVVLQFRQRSRHFLSSVRPARLCGQPRVLPAPAADAEWLYGWWDSGSSTTRPSGGSERHAVLILGTYDAKAPRHGCRSSGWRRGVLPAELPAGLAGVLSDRGDAVTFAAQRRRRSPPCAPTVPAPPRFPARQPARRSTASSRRVPDRG